MTKIEMRDEIFRLRAEVERLRATRVEAKQIEEVLGLGAEVKTQDAEIARLRAEVQRLTDMVDWYEQGTCDTCGGEMLHAGRKTIGEVLT